MTDFDRQTRAERARRRRLRHRVFLASIGGLVAAVVLAAFVLWSSGEGEGVKKEAEKPTQSAVPASMEKPVVTVMMVSRQGLSGDSTETGVLQLALNSAELRVSGLVIPGETYMDVPGVGYAPLTSAYGRGLDDLASSVDRMLGTSTDYTVMVSEVDFSKIEDAKGLKALLDTAGDESNKADGVLRALMEVETVHIEMLPVREVRLGEGLYVEPVSSDAERLTAALWGLSERPEDEDIRVIILNGSGTPGIGRKAADRLLGGQFKIVDLKNANKFGYEQTRIVYYDSSKEKAAVDAAEQLGAGELNLRNLSQNVTDLVIILGDDFKP